MNTITDVLQFLLRIAPVREESVLTEALSILESGREKLDALVHGAENSVQDAQQAVSEVTGTPVVPTAPVTAAPVAPATPAPTVPTVAGL